MPTSGKKGKQGSWAACLPGGKFPARKTARRWLFVSAKRCIAAPIVKALLGIEKQDCESREGTACESFHVKHFPKLSGGTAPFTRNAHHSSAETRKRHTSSCLPPLVRSGNTGLGTLELRIRRSERTAIPWPSKPPTHSFQFRHTHTRIGIQTFGKKRTQAVSKKNGGERP